MTDSPTAPQLRPYQIEAVRSVRARYKQGDRATLLVLPTGAGKTVVIAEVVRLTAERGGCALVLAHRTELLEQAAAKIRAVAPALRVEIEQGARVASADAQAVVASVQTLSRGKRLAKHARDRFALIVIDEAHHATAESYRRILGHFDRAHLLGVTATPDRADDRSLGEVFASVAYSRSMLDLIRDGFLTPLTARTVNVEAFDLSGAQVVGGDLAEGDIARSLGRPGVLEAIAALLAEHSGGRSVIVFVAGVERAHELARLLGPHAVAVDGGTAPDARAAAFEAFASGRARYLVNVGIATEGADLPRCACVAVVRPTMSRPLFVQMVGRGVRPFGAWTVEPGSAEERLAAIAASPKPDCLVLNFAPSNTRHRLIVPTDALMPAGADEEARAIAARAAANGGDLAAIVEDAQRRAPALRRERAIARYRATLEAWEPFAYLAPFADLGIALDLDAAGREVPHAAEHLRRRGVPEDVLRVLSPGMASALSRALEARDRAGLCSIKIARQLARRRLNPNVSRELGRHAMTVLAAERWPRHAPASLRGDPRFALPAGGAA